MAELVFTVSKLSEYAARVLRNDPHLRSIKVSGEISGFKRHSSGHLYFNLKDANAVIGCVMFRSAAQSSKLVLSDGMKVIVHGSAEIYPKDGRFQLIVDSIREEGLGELYQRFLELKEKLGREGVFDNNRPLPLLPRLIGVATSETGAAVNDIITVVRRRFPTMNILLAPCSVQGADAPKEIAAAVRTLQRVKDCDVIIVGRGGGSYEDLSCFNDETVARAIYASAVPVVSAVGHETDFTIADFAADLRAPTPSAAAELCCPVLSDLTESVIGLRDAVEELLEDAFREARSDLSRLTGSAAMSNPRYSIGRHREKLIRRSIAIENRFGSVLSEKRLSLLAAEDRLKAADPNGVIKRGYSIVTDSGGRIIKHASELEPGMQVLLRMNGGSAYADVKKVVLNG